MHGLWSDLKAPSAIEVADDEKRKRKIVPPSVNDAPRVPLIPLIPVRINADGRPTFGY